MLDELMDRFGEPPKSVQNLLAIANMKAAAHRAYLTEIKQRGMEFQLTLYEKPGFDTTQIPELMKQYQGTVQFRTQGKNPYFLFQTRGTQEQMLENVKEFAVKLAQLGKIDYNNTK